MLPTQERKKLASGTASRLVNPSSGSQGWWLGPQPFFCLTYRAKPVADRQPLASYHPHGSSLPTASHIQTYFLQIGLLQRDAYWFSLLNATDHSKSHPMLLVPDLSYLLSGKKSTGAESSPHGVCGSFSTPQELSGGLTLLSCHRQEESI